MNFELNFFKRIATSILVFIFISLFFVYANSTLETPQVTTITTTDSVVREPINIFNDGSGADFTASLYGQTPVIQIDAPSIIVEENSYGSFSLAIDTRGTVPRIYFNSIDIYKENILLFNVPIIVVAEDKSFNLNHDVIIDFQPYDIDYISGETVLSPSLEVHKLNYNSNLNNAILRIFVYTLDGTLLQSSEETISVSGAASFERFVNLGSSPPAEVILVASTESSGRTGFDISQFNTVTGDISLSPVETKDYSSWIYLAVFVLLLGGIVALSYYWNNRVMNQAKDWSSRINYIKKTQFTDSARALRRLKSQRDVLVRAYSNHYVTKESYQKGLVEIDRLTTSLKKRL